MLAVDDRRWYVNEAEASTLNADEMFNLYLFFFSITSKKNVHQMHFYTPIDENIIIEYI